MTNDIGVPEELTLAADFDTPSLQAWADEVAKVLNKGRPENRQLTSEQALERLRTRTVDGLVTEPLYTKDDSAPMSYPAAAPFVRGATAKSGKREGWDIRQLHEDPHAATSARHVLDDLERGATSVWLRVDPDAIKPEDVPTVLADVQMNLARVEVSSRTDQVAAADTLLALAAQSDKTETSITLGLDPIGEAALNGKTDVDLSKLAEYAKQAAEYKDSRAIVVDGTIWHNAGAGDVHEVAWLVATATEYVRALVDAGISVDDAFDTINFRVSATTNQMNTIARLRALRYLWNRVGEVFEVSEEKRGARQQAVTSWREVTRDDAYVNMLRATIATFSAVVGGAEAVTVLPFDTAWGLPTKFSRRIARNTQVVLGEESNIGRVNDPAGGAWSMESLTKQIAEKAWAEFQKIEGVGGMTVYFKAGSVQPVLDGLNEERAKLIATRKLPITGVSEFPNPGEKPVEGPAERPASTVKLDWQRDSEVFEQMRDATKGKAAKVFLACIGTRRDFGGRQGFASNYFHIAGLETPENDGGDVDDIVKAYQAADTPVACLCSSPKVYAAKGLEVAKALKAAGAKKVILAGNIKELGDAETDGVIDGTIALGADVVAGLNDVLETLEVRK